MCQDLDFVCDFRVQRTLRLCKIFVYTSECAGVSGCSTLGGVGEAWNFTTLGVILTCNDNKYSTVASSLY